MMSFFRVNEEEKKPEKAIHARKIGLLRQGYGDQRTEKWSRVDSKNSSLPLIDFN